MPGSENLIIEITGLVLGTVLAFTVKNNIIKNIGYLMMGWFGLGLIFYFF